MDLILYNGNLYTMDKEKEKAQAVALKDGLIAALGSDGDILALKSEHTKVIDLKGKTAIPAFNDSHCHLLGYAIGLSMLDLNGVKSIDEMIERFKAFIKDNNIPAGQEVRGFGWNQNLFEGEQRNPTKYDLDKVSTAHPIYATRACHHVAVVNSTLLEGYGIDKNTPEVSGGEIVREQSGEPIGIFNETAMSLVKKDKVLDAEEIKALVLKAMPNLASMGITSVQSDDFTPRTPFGAVYEAYVNLAKAKKMTFRVNEQCRASGLENYKKMLELKQVDKDVAAYFKLGPVKILADGSLGGRTAFMKEDYYDQPGNKGIPIYGKEEFDAIVDLCHEKDRPVAIHAIGDAIMQWCIDAVKRVQKANPKPGLRHGIIHCQITDEELLREFKANNVIAYIQPIFIHADWGVVADRVGEAKARTSYAFKTLKDLGVYIPLGTDCPVEGFDPFKNIYCAVTRKDLHGQPEGGYNPHEALSVYEAVYAYTADSAYASYEEDVKGRIKAGMYGDIAVLSKNIFEVKHEEILETEVEMTVFDGKIIYGEEV
ncbi:MAG: amidohydrolase [Defluviitaleaceae bacterium]|nr:amidohydrolase [Defluviitaleaceae bacterium]